MNDTFVVEIATTGIAGCPKDAVVEIAICRLFPDFSDYDSVYDAMVYMDPKDLGYDALERIDSLYGISPDELYLGDDVSKVSDDVRKILSGSDCISFDKTTFARFLCFEPWDLNRSVSFMPAISLMIPRIFTETESLHQIYEVYHRFFNDDPAGVGDDRSALSMAQMCSCVVGEMRRRGFY